MELGSPYQQPEGKNESDRPIARLAVLGDECFTWPPWSLPN